MIKILTLMNNHEEYKFFSRIFILLLFTIFLLKTLIVIIYNDNYLYKVMKK
jgi:energy-converting hydrogenase Eha subunit F